VAANNAIELAADSDSLNANDVSAKALHNLSNMSFLCVPLDAGNGKIDGLTSYSRTMACELAQDR
jgi:hypothetical protein